jgi:phosphoglycerol geranylgeranyltransferase
MNQQQRIITDLQQLRQKNSKKIAVLLDPDKVNLATLPAFVDRCARQGVGYFFVGGSLISKHQSQAIIQVIRDYSQLPVVIFPGSNLHIEPSADAILLLSLISGRNPEFLIGQHVVAAPLLRASGLEILSTGYMLIDSGRQTTVSYISNTTPIPADKPDIAACTALAGEMLGLKLIYLDGGSGAQNPVSAQIIQKVRSVINTPLIVGGGINTVQKAQRAFEAGADVIVVGNALETNPNFINDLAILTQNLVLN